MGNALYGSPVERLFGISMKITTTTMRFNDDLADAEFERDRCRNAIIEAAISGANDKQLKAMALKGMRHEKRVESIAATIDQMDALQTWVCETRDAAITHETLESISSVMRHMTEAGYDPQKTEHATAEFTKLMASLRKHADAEGGQVDAVVKETSDEAEAEAYLEQIKAALAVPAAVKTAPVFQQQQPVVAVPTPETTPQAPPSIESEVDELEARLRSLNEDL